MSEAPQGPSGPNKNIESEHARILAEVMDDQAKKKAARAATVPVRKSGETSFFVQVALLVSGTFFFYLLFFSPTWVTPTAAEPITAEKLDEGLKAAIFLSGGNVTYFQSQNGRLPDNNREAGITMNGVEYERIDAQRYRITAVGRGDTLTYTFPDDGSLEEFAGDALGVLAGTGGSSQ